MKKIIITFLMLAFSALFFYRYIGNTFNFHNSQKTQASLKIESIPEGASVFIDDKEAGITPVVSTDIEAGIRKVKLLHNSFIWEGKVEIANNAETFVKRILGPSGAFSGGVTISYQKTKNGSNDFSLAIIVKPEEAEVFIDGEEYQAPVIMDRVLAGKHKLEVVLNGYLNEEIEVKTEKGLLANVDVEMIIEPFGKGKISTEEERIITEGKISTEEERIITEIVSRAEWGGEVLDVLNKEFFFKQWQKIEVYPVVYTKLVSAREIIQGMDFYAREFLGLPGIPFAYLITEGGEVYEGLGIRNFDFGEIENFQFSPGISPIVYLSTSNVELSDAAKKTLVKLRSYLAGPPKQKAKLITVLNPITVGTGKTREISLEFQNIGEVTWESEGGNRVFLVTLPLKRSSQFYIKDAWIAVDTIALPQEERILPGQIAKFTFPVSAPFYPDTITESLGLLIEGTESFIEGSEISLEIDVSAEGLVAVEIKETPTGFLNVRDGPSTYAELIGTVYPGEKYLFLEESEGWYKIKLRDGSEGWVYAKYVGKK